MSLLTVGTVAFDAIETPFGKVDKIVGGAATYISIAASYFKNDINLVSVVGDDFPDKDLNDLKKRGVDLSGLQVKKGEKSFFWSGKYHDNMNKRDTLVTDLNVLADFDPILPESYKKSDYVMLGNLTPAVQKRVLDQMKKRPKLVAMDTMNFWMDIAMDELKTVIKRVDILTINDEEARQLSGKYSLVAAAKEIFTMGPKFLVIKKGEHGALLFYRDEIFYAPAMPLESVYDPTGAGDTFAGGFMGFMAQSGRASFANMKRAMIYGSALASFCVEQFGTEAIKPLDKKQIDDRVKQFSKLVQFSV